MGRPLFPGDRDGRLNRIAEHPMVESRAHGNAILLVTSSYEVRHDLESFFAPSERRLVHAGTPLCALRWLQDPLLIIEAALIDLHFERLGGFEFLSFLRETFVDVRRILIGRDADRDTLETAVRAGEAHALLTRPWTSAEVETVLSRPL